MSENQTFTRICPRCGKQIIHINKEACHRAKKAKRTCNDCVHDKHRIPPENWVRVCLICNNTIQYKTYAAWWKAKKNNCACRACSRTLNSKDHTTNPDAWKRICPECKKTIQYSSYSACRQAKRKNSACFNCTRPKRTTGKTRVCPDCGKTVVHTSRAGRRNAEREHRACQSCANKKRGGKRNALYGVTPPQTTGYGWNGRYKGTFFRSSLELFFIINVLEKRNKSWRSAETHDLRIPYKAPNGSDRTYVADFLVNEKILVEIKMLKHQQTPVVQAKAKAAKDFCKKRGWRYVMIDPGGFTKKEMIKLRKENVIKLSRRDEKKYQRYIKRGL